MRHGNDIDPDLPEEVAAVVTLHECQTNANNFLSCQSIYHPATAIFRYLAQWNPLHGLHQISDTHLDRVINGATQTYTVALLFEKWPTYSNQLICFNCAFVLMHCVFWLNLSATLFLSGIESNNGTIQSQSQPPLTIFKFW